MLLESSKMENDYSISVVLHTASKIVHHDEDTENMRGWMYRRINGGGEYPAQIIGHPQKQLSPASLIARSVSLQWGNTFLRVECDDDGSSNNSGKHT